MIAALLAAPAFWLFVLVVGIVATALAKATEPYDPYTFDREGES